MFFWLLQLLGVAAEQLSSKLGQTLSNRHGRTEQITRPISASTMKAKIAVKSALWTRTTKKIYSRIWPNYRTKEGPDSRAKPVHNRPSLTAPNAVGNTLEIVVGIAALLQGADLVS